MGEQARSETRTVVEQLIAGHAPAEQRRMVKQRMRELTALFLSSMHGHKFTTSKEFQINWNTDISAWNCTHEKLKYSLEDSSFAINVCSYQHYKNLKEQKFSILRLFEKK